MSQNWYQKIQILMCTFRKSKQMPKSERKKSHGFSFSFWGFSKLHMKDIMTLLDSKVKANLQCFLCNVFCNDYRNYMHVCIILRLILSHVIRHRFIICRLGSWSSLNQLQHFVLPIPSPHLPLDPIDNHHLAFV